MEVINSFKKNGIYYDVMKYIPILLLYLPSTTSYKKPQNNQYFLLGTLSRELENKKFQYKKTNLWLLPFAFWEEMWENHFEPKHLHFLHSTSLSVVLFAELKFNFFHLLVPYMLYYKAAYTSKEYFKHLFIQVA